MNKGCIHYGNRKFIQKAGLQYKIIDKKGCDNAAADALSRYPHDSTQLWSIYQCTPLCV
jgi:hypothetical protein